jgi:hypothetical protein
MPSGIEIEPNEALHSAAVVVKITAAALFLSPLSPGFPV